jgi:hypothetical protein
MELKRNLEDTGRTKMEIKNNTIAKQTFREMVEEIREAAVLSEKCANLLNVPNCNYKHHATDMANKITAILGSAMVKATALLD